MDDLVEEVVGIGGRDLCLLRPRDAEALLNEEAFEHEEFLPYWAELWPSALALARAVGARALRGARTLELGLRPRAAEPRRRASPGGRVLATDWAPDVDRDDRRATPSATGSRSRRCAAPGPSRSRCSSARPWDLVLASDVLYEPRNGEALLPLLPAPGRRPRRDLARRPRPPRRRPVPGPRPPRPSRSTPARPPRSPREPSTTSVSDLSLGCQWGMSTQREKAEELRRLHAAPEPLVLVNAWDAASARVVAAAPGCRAIATASWSIAAAHGLPGRRGAVARGDDRRRWASSRARSSCR